MIGKALYERIIGLLPSSALKAHLKDTGTVVPEIDLLRIAYLYANNYEEQIGLLTELGQVCEDEGDRALAAHGVGVMQASLAAFEQNDGTFVYEIGIRDRWEWGEDCYLCATLADALALIPRYYKEYESTAESSSYYRIVKRPILSQDKGIKIKGQEVDAECLYRAGPTLYRVDDRHGNPIDCQREDCEECYEPCMVRLREDLCFPSFLKDGEIVRFRDGGEQDCRFYRDGRVRYGYHWATADPGPQEECYIIPLDQYWDETDEEIYNWHQHWSAAVVEPVDVEELEDETLRRRLIHRSQVVRQQIAELEAKWNKNKE